MTDRREPRFALGELHVTPNAFLAILAFGIDLEDCLERHVRGDWGILDAHDRRVNEEALRNSERLLSVYPLPVPEGSDFPDGESLWVITEAQRRTTTVLLAREY